MPFRRSSLLPLLAALLPQAAWAQGACGAAVAETRKLVESDVATGNLNEPVGKRFAADLDRAAAACAAGRGPEAMRLLGAAKARYGYR